MNIACIDLEGVLMPEMWPHIGEKTGIAGLALTTREEPDYARLMQRRIALLREHGLTLTEVQRLVKPLQPLPGAIRFIATLAEHYKVLIVSDAFHELVDPFSCHFGSPPFLCHNLVSDENDFITECKFLPRRGKEDVIRTLHVQGHRTLAVGDAFNDLAMLRQATKGFLFQPSQETLQYASDLNHVRDYQSILDAVSFGHSDLQLYYA